MANVGLSMLIRLVLLVAVFIWFQIVPPSTAFLFPLGLIGLAAFGLMLGVLLAPVSLLYRDVQQGLPVFTTFLMFLTPVIYPTPKSGVAATLSSLNPLAPLVNTTRDWLTTGAAADTNAFFVTLLASIALLFVFWTAYRVALPHVVARMGN
jgi:lipopolysaccharide transport system permease protein